MASNGQLSPSGSVATLTDNSTDTYGFHGSESATVSDSQGDTLTGTLSASISNISSASISTGETWSAASSAWFIGGINPNVGTSHETQTVAINFNGGGPSSWVDDAGDTLTGTATENSGDTQVGIYSWTLNQVSVGEFVSNPTYFQPTSSGTATITDTNSSTLDFTGSAAYSSTDSYGDTFIGTVSDNASDIVGGNSSITASWNAGNSNWNAATSGGAAYQTQTDEYGYTGSGPSSWTDDYGNSLTGTASQSFNDDNTAAYAWNLTLGTNGSLAPSGGTATVNDSNSYSYEYSGTGEYSPATSVVGTQNVSGSENFTGDYQEAATLISGTWTPTTGTDDYSAQVTQGMSYSATTAYSDWNENIANSVTGQQTFSGATTDASDFQTGSTLGTDGEWTTTGSGDDVHSGFDGEEYSATGIEAVTYPEEYYNDPYPGMSAMATVTQSGDSGSGFNFTSDSTLNASGSVTESGNGTTDDYSSEQTAYDVQGSASSNAPLTVGSEYGTQSEADLISITQQSSVTTGATTNWSLSPTAGWTAIDTDSFNDGDTSGSRVFTVAMGKEYSGTEYWGDTSIGSASDSHDTTVSVNESFSYAYADTLTATYDSDGATVITGSGSGGGSGTGLVYANQSASEQTTGSNWNNEYSSEGGTAGYNYNETWTAAYGNNGGTFSIDNANSQTGSATYAYNGAAASGPWGNEYGQTLNQVNAGDGPEFGPGYMPYVGNETLDDYGPGFPAGRGAEFGYGTEPQTAPANRFAASTNSTNQAAELVTSVSDAFTSSGSPFSATASIIQPTASATSAPLPNFLTPPPVPHYPAYQATTYQYTAADYDSGFWTYFTGQLFHENIGPPAGEGAWGWANPVAVGSRWVGITALSIASGGLAGEAVVGWLGAETAGTLAGTSLVGAVGGAAGNGVQNALTQSFSGQPFSVSSLGGSIVNGAGYGAVLGSVFNLAGAAIGGLAGSFSGQAASNVASTEASAAGSGQAAGNAETGGVDIQLRYKSGWTSDQIAQADAKVTALNDAAGEGNLKTTRPIRGTTSAKAIYEDAGFEVPGGMDVDHVIDLQLGGVDDLQNLQPLDISVNRSLGSQLNHAIKNLPLGTIIRSVTIRG